MWLHVLLALHEFLHWFNMEYWGTSWPNIFAPSVYTILGFVVADIRNGHRAKDTKLHHIDTTSDLAGQIADLSDRLVALIGGSDDNSTE